MNVTILATCSPCPPTIRDVAACAARNIDPVTLEPLPPRPAPPTDTERVVAALLAEGVIHAGKRAAVVRGLDAARVATAETEHGKRKTR